MKLFVVVLCYRVPDLTIDCLRSLSREVERVPGTRVCVCENGTGGDTPERLEQAIESNGWSSWCALTVVYPNRGFTGGNNLVIRPVLESGDPPQYVLLLNADTIVLEDALDALVQFMDDHPEVGIAGSELLSPEGTVQASPFRFPSVLTELDRGLRLGIISKWIAPRITATTTCRADWVSGASMILRRSMLAEIGLLDEGLYTYFDDVDICLRAQCAGWQTWYVPQSKVIHLEGAATGVAARDETAARLLVRGAATVLPEKLRQIAHGTRRRRIPVRLCSVATACARSSANRISIAPICWPTHSAIAFFAPVLCSEKSKTPRYPTRRTLLFPTNPPKLRSWSCDMRNSLFLLAAWTGAWLGMAATVRSDEVPFQADSWAFRPAHDPLSSAAVWNLSQLNESTAGAHGFIGLEPGRQQLRSWRWAAHSLLGRVDLRPGNCSREKESTPTDLSCPISRQARRQSRPGSW